MSHWWLKRISNKHTKLEAKNKNEASSSSIPLTSTPSWDTNDGVDAVWTISPLTLLELAQKMRQEISVEDRRWNFKIYKKCFLESDALKWLQLQVPMAAKSSEKEAIKIGNCMIEAGYISHVKDVRFYRHRFNDRKHQTKPNFFRFHNDKLLLSSFLLETNSYLKQNSTIKQTTCTATDEAVQNIRNNIGTVKANITLLSESFLNLMNVVQDANHRLLIFILFESLLLFTITALVLFGRYSSALSPMAIRMTYLLLILQPIVLLGFSWKSYMAHQNLQVFKCLLETIAVGRVEEIKTSSALPVTATEEGGRDSTTLLRRLPLGESFRHLRDVTKKMRDSITGADSISETLLQEKHSVPPPSKWPHYPVLVTANNTKKSPERIHIFDYKDFHVPLGIPFEFESELFRGTALFRFKGVPSDDEEGSTDYFNGRERRFQAVIQGRFKEELSCADVITGHEFDQSFRNLPPAWVIGAGRALIKQLAPGVQFDLTSSTPRFFSLLAATSQAISVDNIDVPDIRSREIPENCSAISDQFFQKSSSNRKKMLSDPRQAARFSYGTDAVYTFDFYQHLLDVSTYELNLGLVRLCISESLNKQPIQILAKTTDGRYLWSFCIWHESLFSDQEYER